MPDKSINTAATFELKEQSLTYKFIVGCLKGFVQRASFIVGPAGELHWKNISFMFGYRSLI